MLKDLSSLKREHNIYLDGNGAASEAPSSGALFGGEGGEGRPALLDFLTAAVWAQHLAFFVVHKRQNLVEEFLAFLAEEFVVRHADLPQF